MEESQSLHCRRHVRVDLFETINEDHILRACLLARSHHTFHLHGLATPEALAVDSASLITDLLSIRLVLWLM
jgi:hypothetical protein